MYRFLLTPRWIGGFVLAVAAAAVMLLLGNWQHHRYDERNALNARVDAGATATPADITTVLGRPAAPGTAGPRPADDAAWSRVTMTGRYDAANEILVRSRTVNDAVGYEVVTPLVLADGTAVLVDRGWIPPAPGGATAVPAVPAVPAGQVTVVGRVHPSESRPGAIERRDGRIQVRRVAVDQLAGELPYPVYGGYVLMTEQTPAADPAFVPIPVEHENALQNGGYAIQWWLFAAMALAAYGWLAWREAHPRPAAATPAAR
ncbi:SURF1 family cytochrome oxidase biogenesis protein [Spirilliplanes yamanashiensis]|uniref:SURF1-like protein n=1 Tax=Spirilliplanes yamanashiensis TaxID=42233 RepID=A0A8J4DLE2_9ACTN|nr:SURF1 family protein [Spirilliplanes yamanashiensis]MDP9816379.1 cytochrome oxidase assembly protein ShyY1 [Spirilliplanes yamanashiensis]GIJ05906.1 SURF1-like protein [Spirilliplanes yamanashiensis]